MMPFLRRGLAAGFALALAWPAAAQDFPTRDIRFLNAFPPGGTSDLLGRVLAEQLSQQMGRRVVVDNRTGAGGTIAAGELARAAPDGYTILLTSMGIMAVAPLMQRLPYDTDRDITPIVNVANVYNILVAAPSSPIRTWQDVVRLSRERPGSLRCATVGPGSSQQLSCALFMSLTGTRLEQVAYRGGAPAILDIVAGRVDLMFGNMPEYLAQIRGGGLRAIAYGAAEASPLMPELPVMSRDGLANFIIPNWFGVAGPGGLPPALVQRWNTEINRALEAPDVQRRFRENGMLRIGGTPADVHRQIAMDRERWGGVIREHDIKPE